MLCLMKQERNLLMKTLVWGWGVEEKHKGVAVVVPARFMSKN